MLDHNSHRAASPSLFAIVCLALLTLLPVNEACAAGRRIALLIGNAGYAQQVGPLKNPKNDIRAIQATLESIGFKHEDIRSIPDATRIDILSAIDALAARAKDLGPDDVVFFYYSGHGAAQPGKGMSLIPIDAKDATTSQFWYDTIDLEGGVISAFEGAHSGATWILAIDACRNELNLPTRALGDGDKGFVLSSASAGMLISYAAGKGKTARDEANGSANSPYAEALMEEIRRPGRPVSATFAALTKNVMKRTNNVQKPDLALNVIDDPVLVEAASALASAQTPAVAPAPAPQLAPQVDISSYFSRRVRGLSDVQLAAMDAIVGIFESGRPANYGAIARNPTDVAGLSYGKHQAALVKGGLFKLVSVYCDKPDARYCGEFKPYLARLKAEDAALNTDADLFALLKKAATDPAMQEAQDEYFFEVRQKAAITQWSSFGFKTALSAAVIYDSYIHSGGLKNVLEATNARYGAPSAANEKAWTAGYVAERKAWLESRGGLLRNTAIRMTAFQELIAADNWTLSFPMNIRRAAGDAYYPLTPYDLADWLFQDPIHRLGASAFGNAKPGTASPSGRVRFVQAGLARLGYLPSDAVDGNFGPGVAKGVRAFQKAMSLPEKDEVDGPTFDALCRELEKLAGASPRNTP